MKIKSRSCQSFLKLLKVITMKAIRYENLISFHTSYVLSRQIFPSFQSSLFSRYLTQRLKYIPEKRFNFYLSSFPIPSLYAHALFFFFLNSNLQKFQTNISNYISTPITISYKISFLAKSLHQSNILNLDTLKTFEREFQNAENVVNSLVYFPDI